MGGKSVRGEVHSLISAYGQSGFYAAETAVCAEEESSGLLSDALKYFLNECWRNTQHPALISFCCAAIHGKPNTNHKLSAAVVLLTGAADLHDDIIDKSLCKASKPTVLGKFGLDAALLSGDALLVKALSLFREGIQKFPEGKRHQLSGIVEEAFLEMANATLRERALKGRLDFRPEEYYSVIKAKGAVSEACARIGAVIGGGTRKETAALGYFGRTLGFLMTLRNEFSDLFAPEELRNRGKNEVLPLPLWYAFQNDSAKKEIQSLLKGKATKQNALRIADLALATEYVQGLVRRMRSMVILGKWSLKAVKGNTEPLRLLLQFSVEDL